MRTHSFSRVPLIICASLLGTCLLGQTQEQHARVRISLNTAAGGMERLAALGLAVDHGGLKAGTWITTDLSMSEIAMARAAGFSCEELIPDVGTYYRARNAAATHDVWKDNRNWCSTPYVHPLPAQFALGNMGGYFTWQEMQDQLDAMRSAYPGLISAIAPIGITVEGRPIHFVRISNAPDIDQEKPEVLYDALHHAREPASLHQLITYMWYLLQNYGTDAEVTYLVDHLEMYFIPCLNPDGYVYNELTAPDGGGLWRKNRRDNGDGTFGVDLNRNYGEGWGTDDIGSSPNPSSQVYRGPSPFSEPETQAIRDFCNDHQFRLALNNHTFGNLLVYPWGYEPSFYTPDSAVFVNHSVRLTNDNRYRFGTADQTVNYVVNGGSDDWMYGEQETKPKIIAMTPEAGFETEGFWPPIARIPAICQENIGPNLRLAHLALVHGKAEDRTPSIMAGTDPYIRFALQRLGLEPGPLTVSLEPLDNVVGVGTPLTFSGMELLETRLDSIVVQLDPFLTNGTTFRYVVAVDNGAYVHRDTLTKISGVPTVLFASNGTSLAGWQNSGWGTTTTTWVSPPGSITDSPLGNYGDFEDSGLTTSQPIDLANAAAAMLTFRAKWDLEAYYDHVQVSASTNGNTWTPLCGRHTRTGVEAQDEGAPLYDGQQPNWVWEEMSLEDYIGGPVRLRIRLASDEATTYDGFYFDDLLVTATNSGSSALHEQAVPTLLPPQPNPAIDHVWLSYALPVGARDARLIIYNAVGSLVRTSAIEDRQGSLVLSVSDLAPGVYHVGVSVAGAASGLQKLVVM